MSRDFNLYAVSTKNLGALPTVPLPSRLFPSLSGHGARQSSGARARCSGTCAPDTDDGQETPDRLSGSARGHVSGSHRPAHPAMIGRARGQNPA